MQCDENREEDEERWEENELGIWETESSTKLYRQNWDFLRYYNVIISSIFCYSLLEMNIKLFLLCIIIILD